MLKYNPDIIQHLDSECDGVVEFYDNGYRIKTEGIYNLKFVLTRLIDCLNKYVEEDYLLIHGAVIEVGEVELYRPDLIAILENELDEEEDEKTYSSDNIGLILDVFNDGVRKVNLKKRLRVFSELGSLRYYIAIYPENKTAYCWSVTDEGCFLNKSTEKHLKIGDLCVIPKKEIFETKTLPEV